ncbi:ABC transporter ATP-binding protein [Burkholderia vietnamiensis]|uniref:ABC transporter ATP-binding protein n=1 Tax=Burkholderia vietnamiensis TaxID=60552 RepID=UPI0007591386|nr:ABC transporter ATP-binding protein [Burkholderia vietnamiensis]KVF31513.1 ABC transporter ATP-binding protein [Burkholderia vietnamiensis]MBR8279945.1 ABC transporter ATP-binding protein [Burkholderia vietnamiensis]HDR9000265.1 ABC transporter ATP-binding protein [Burkholderia vietnamiensis]HDR9031722.1 ABC transporter ATP-binding protein [Burkholderia vietnamiensis]
MSSDVVIRAAALAKGFESYRKPSDRLKRSLFSVLSGLAPIPIVRESLRHRAQACTRMFWALKDVDFEITRGETVGIIGRNGSGKSTLLQIICGTLAPTSGTVETRGRIAALLELGSGFDAEYSGRENIYINGQLHGLTREQIDLRVDEIIAFADIGHFIDQPVKTYSSGMFVRLAFAVIAHVDADILVIDEALAVGDAFFTQKCMRFLRRFQQTGTVLFVSHDSSAIRGLCDRVIWLDRGVMRESGSAKTVCMNYFEAFYRKRGDDSVFRVELGSKKSDVTAAGNVPRADQRSGFPRTTIETLPTLPSVALDPHELPAQRDSILIESTALTNAKGTPVSWVTGGERVSLRIRIRRTKSGTPHIAFFVKDRLGQPLFGDDSVLALRETGSPSGGGNHAVAEFRFDMPILPPGDYAFTVLAAAPSNNQIRVLDCVHDAVIVKSESARVATGLVGAPMNRIELFVQETT